MGRGRSGRWRVCAGAALLVSPAVTSAQDAPPANHDDIVITGKRVPGSVIGDVAPVALLDGDAIRALGVTKIDDMLRLLKPLTTSNSGADPVFLLNGRRISGYQELQTLPPEAIERTEILPETEAARFGFPATVRVVNFITKKHFRSLAVQETAGTTTDGGADSAALEVGLTRLDGAKRTSLTVNYDRQDGLNGAQRPTIPDPSGAFDSVGNIRGVGGGSIDPALDALAGRPVTVAAVPIDPAARGTLSGYLSGANAPRITNLAPYQSIPSRDVLKIDGTQAVPIDASTTGSLNLTLERQRGSGLAGLPTAILRVPGGTARSLFANDVLLYRYVTEAGALRLWNDSLTLHAGSTVQGSIKRWQWSVTAGYDRARAASTVEQGIPLTDVQAAITAGADPFAPLSGDQAARRLLARSRTTTGTTAAKATANGPVLRLPAGDAQMTLAADYARSTSSGTLVGGDTPTLDLSRTTRSGSVSVDLPIASADKGVLAAIGTLSANGTIGASAVSGYRSLVNSNVALSWTPVAPVQLTASINTTQTPPAIALLTNPVITLPNAPLFDFVTGSSALVTVIAGGNADLTPERRRISTAGVSWKPIKARELRFNLDYIETLISDQTANPGSVTAALQAAFPDRFQRDAGGRLLNADLRPLNLSRERERKVQARMSMFTQLGPEPKPPTTPPAKDAPPPPPPKPRPMIYSFVTAIARIDDRLTLSPGQPTLDLLDGATLDGTGGRPRYEISGGFGASYRAVRSGFYAQWQSGTRIRSDIAASDLRFSARTSAYFYTTVDAALLAPKLRWTKSMTFQFEVLNLLNTRMTVQDRNGVTPYRFQPLFLDPYGRIVKLSVRKLF